MEQDRQLLTVELAVPAVGIVGVVTGFASVCVNGVEVHFEHGVPVSENGDPSSADKLAIGHVVSIDATNSPKGFMARNIAILNALEGPVTKLIHGGKSVQILGQTVSIVPNTRGSPQGLAVGQLVKVSALSGANGALIATRIQLSPNLKQASALGQVVVTGKLSTINGIAVSGTINANAALIHGHWTGTELVPKSIKPDPTYRFKNSANRILVEGLVQTSDGRGNVTVAGLHLSLPNATVTEIKSLQPNQRIFFDARVGNSGRLVVEHFELNEAIPAENRQLPALRNAEFHDSTATKTATTEIAESIEKSETPERAERAERAERVEKVDKVEKVEKVERVERH